MTAFQIPYHSKPEGSYIKMEPSSRDNALWSPVQDMPGSLPPIRDWYPDDDSTRRSSTTSIASSSAYTPREGQSPVIGDIGTHERAIRRLSQISGQMLSSPYPSPTSTPGPEDHIVQKSKTRAKARSVRGANNTKDMAIQKNLTPDEVAKAKAKATRETLARQEQSWAYSRLWEVILLINPDILRLGVTKDGVRGLRPLKRNNIDEGIERAGHQPNQINKDQIIDLAAIMIEQLREIILAQVEILRSAGQQETADQLEQALKAVGTYLHRPHPRI